MKKAIVFLLLLASFAMAQRQRVVVLPSLADPETKLTPKQLDLLTEDIRSVVTKTLPSTEFILLKQDEVMKKLGDQAFVRACKEGVCLGSLMEEVDANFGARCEVYAVNEQLYMRFELYGTMKGQSGAGTIDQFNDPVKNFAEMQAKIKTKIPGIFEIIVKSPQQLCEAKGQEWAWINGDCKSSVQIARETCVAMGNTWINGECKSQAQIACEVMTGRKWTGTECKTVEQIECEKKDSVWENGVCKNKTQIVQNIGGSTYFVAKITTIPAGATLHVNEAPYAGCEKTPCTVSSYHNKIKLSLKLDEYKTTDTIVTITQPNQPVNINLEPRDYAVYFESTPPQIFLSFDGKTNYSCKSPCKIDLKKGNVKVSASMNLYETKDTTIVVAEDNQQVKLNLPSNYGTLNLKTKGDNWNLIVDNKVYALDYARFKPGTYNFKLTNECYEDIDFSTEVKKGESTVIDISDKITQKKGILDLHVKYKDKEQKEPVFIDGNEVGNTPLKALIPVCSQKVEFGKDKINVNLDNLKKSGVEYTHRLPTLKNTLLSLAIGLVGGVLLYHAYDLNSDANYYMDEYNSLNSGKISEYDRLRKSAKDANDKVPFYLISGGVLAVSAVGVYVWF